MLKIGITGSLGSGKSYIAERIKTELGYQIIEVDDIRRELLWQSTTDKAINLREKLAKNFNLSTTTNNLWLDREIFTNVIFLNQQNLKESSDIMTPYIKDSIKEKLTKNSLIVWAYLIEENYLDIVDFTVLIYSSKKTILNRLSTHNMELLNPRILLEPSFESRVEKLKQNNHLYIIHNNG